MNLRALISITALFLSANALAQYQMLPEKNASWWVQSKQIIDNETEVVTDHRWVITGDTMIDSTFYAVINDGAVYFRQVPDSGKVYAIFGAKEFWRYDYDTTAEILLYDFGLEVNDLWNGFNYLGEDDSASDQCVVIDLDTVVIQGKELKRIYMLGNEGSFMWIEGIGSLGGPFNSAFSFEHRQVLCDMKSDSLNHETRLCWNFSSRDMKKPVGLYPNPVSAGGYIQFEDVLVNSKMELFNLNGELAWTQKYEQTSEVELPNHLTSGTYMLRVISSDGTFNQRVLVK